MFKAEFVTLVSLKVPSGTEGGFFRPKKKSSTRHTQANISATVSYSVLYYVWL